MKEARLYAYRTIGSRSGILAVDRMHERITANDKEGDKQALFSFLFLLLSECNEDDNKLAE